MLKTTDSRRFYCNFHVGRTLYEFDLIDPFLVYYTQCLLHIYIASFSQPVNHRLLHLTYLVFVNLLRA